MIDANFPEVCIQQSISGWKKIFCQRQSNIFGVFMISSMDINRHHSYEHVCLTGLSGPGGILSLVFMSRLEGQVYREIPKVVSDNSAFSECKILSRQAQLSFPKDVRPL